MLLPFPLKFIQSGNIIKFRENPSPNSEYASLLELNIKHKHIENISQTLFPTSSSLLAKNDIWENGIFIFSKVR